MYLINQTTIDEFISSHISGYVCACSIMVISTWRWRQISVFFSSSTSIPFVWPI